MTTAEKFRDLLEDDPRYHAEAYNFVYEALDYTLKQVVEIDAREPRHVSGNELLEGIRQLSIGQFGCLVQSVFETWGVRKTDDFGEIVFNLVAHDLMGKQESDSPEDFKEVYDFGDVFDVVPLFHFSRENEEWKARYVTRNQLMQTDVGPGS